MEKSFQAVSKASRDESVAPIKGPAHGRRAVAGHGPWCSRGRLSGVLSESWPAVIGQLARQGFWHGPLPA